MADTFQRLFTMSGPEVLALNEQAALGALRAPERSQFAHLFRHFMARFFNHETASPDGDAKTRLVQIAFAAGLPGLMVAVYLWPVYHPFPGWPPGRHSHDLMPSYWLQVNHHFFFVMYSFVVMGIATVFEWDLFFPDLLDIFVLRPLPVAESRVFAARVTAIAVFIVGFLLDANIMAPLVLPLSMDPPSLGRFLAGHLLAVAGSGLFAAVFVLALEGALLSILGERLFRRLSLLLQGFSVAALLMLLLLFPVLSGAVPAALRSGSTFALWFPPFWFLGIYQRLMEGPAAPAIYTRLAQMGCAATLATIAIAVIAYPLAYVRRVHQLVEGATTRRVRPWLSRPLDDLLHATVVRPPVRRAMFHFIGQTLLRVPRYRIYLVLYGGVGVSVVTATILRLAVVHDRVTMAISADGIRAALGIVAFWTIAGLCVAFASPGNRQGSWIFHVVHGRPPQFAAAIEQSRAAQVRVLLWAGCVTAIAGALFCTIAPPQLLRAPAIAAQGLVTGGICLLLIDIFFLNTTTAALIGEPRGEQPNLAFTVLKYFTFFPVVAALPLATEPWIEKSAVHLATAAIILYAAHLVLRLFHRKIMKEYCDLPGREEDENEFSVRLGLRV